MSPKNPKNLPTALTSDEDEGFFLITYDGEIQEPQDLTGLSSAEDVICEDAKVTNVLLKFHLQALKQPMTIKTLCGLSLTILKTLEARRKLLLLPTQAPVERQLNYRGDGDGGYLVPFDVTDTYEN